MRWNVRKIWPWLLGVLFLLWLYIAFYSNRGYEELLIPAGTDQFTATFSRVSNIIPIHEDVSPELQVEGKDVAMTIQFTDMQDGTVIQADVSGNIHTSGYTSTDNVHSDELPIELMEGHTYTVQYWALCEGQTLDDLSLALYGDTVSYRWLQVTILVIVLMGMGGLVWFLRDRKAMVPAMLLVWASLYVLYLLSMPLQLRTEEETAFARAYAVSNEMMGLEAEDAQGDVYMDDIGLRDSGYLSYEVPFYRFWSNIGSSADTSRAATITYVDDGSRTLRTYVDAAAITAARRLGISYPVVYLAGSILMGVLGLIVLTLVLTLCKNASRRVRILSVAVLPSLMTLLQLHSGLMGLFRSLESTLPWLQVDEILRRIVLYVESAELEAFLITWVPIVGLGMFAWSDVNKKTMPEQTERALLVGMVITSAITALLRLQM